MFVLFSSLSQGAHCVLMGIIGQGHCISSELLRDDKSSSFHSFANFCAKPNALDTLLCDITTLGVEPFMGITPTVQFYCLGLIICGPFSPSAYAFAGTSPETLVPPPALAGWMQECSFFAFDQQQPSLPQFECPVGSHHSTASYTLQSFMSSSF